MFNSPFHNHVTPLTPLINDVSPWGEIQRIIPCIHGVTFVTTARHGGMHVSHERLQQMPESMRSRDHWYEEDCEVALPMYCFFTEFDLLGQVGPNITVKYLEEQIREYFGIEV